MSTPQLIVALGARRQVGKDTLARLLNQLDSRFVPFSFASALKNDLRPFIQQHYGIDVLNCTTEKKEIIRPLLIAHGMCQRSRDSDYWVERTVEEIQDSLSRAERFVERAIIPIVTDARFVNEVLILRSTFRGFRFINVTRDGAPPPTDEETKHCEIVGMLADYQLRWGNETESQQLERAREVLRWLIKS